MFFFFMLKMSGWYKGNDIKMKKKTSIIKIMKILKKVLSCLP